MSSQSWSFVIDNAPRRSAADLHTDQQERAAIEEERAERRRHDLEELRSNLNLPTVRIRAWEKMHGLRLPSGAAHPILNVIASGTGLTLAEVQEEQQVRRAAQLSRAEQQTGSEPKETGEVTAAAP
jgi:hypothetical protein